MLVVFDLDGTLAKVGDASTAETVALLHRIRETGARIALSSGKPTFYLCAFARQLGLQDAVLVGENGSVQDISIDGLTFERKPAKNVVLKGRGVVSVQPNQSYVAAPENAWLLVEGCKNVQIRNARGVDENGNPLVQCHRN